MASYSSEPDAPKTPAPDLVQTVRDCFQAASDAEAKQREREREDLKIFSGDQWPDEVKQQRMGGQVVAGMPPVPPRPMITVNIVRQPVRQILNQERMADMAVSVVPAADFEGLAQDDEASKDEIELREGLIRRIQRQSDAQRARSWAFERAAQAGRGYWRVLTRYVSPKSFDQELYIERIWNQACVYPDPAHQQPDGSDCQWWIITDTLPFDTYKRQFPHGKVASAEEFTSLMDIAPAWFAESAGEPSVKIAEYFYTQYETVELLQVQTAQGLVTVEQSGYTGPDEAIVARRTADVPTIMWAKVNGVEVLDGPRPWPGKYMPIIKVVGEELQPYDDDRRVQGVVRPAIDAQRGCNYMISAAVEAIGLAPKAPYMATPEQIEGYEDMYAQANVRNFPVLFYNRVEVPGGDKLPPPARQIAEPAIDAIMGAYSAFRMGVKDTTGIPDASLGNVDPAIKSGRAILALQKQSEQGTSNYLSNMAQSVAYEGKILNDLLKPIYGNRPGRLVEIVNGNNESQRVALSPKGQGQPRDKAYELTESDFNVAIKVGRNYDTRREESSASMAEVFAAQPTMFPLYADLFFAQQDWPGSQQFAKRAKATLPPPIKQAEEMEQHDPAMVAQQLQAQLQQLGQLYDLTVKELNAKNQYIETEQIKSEKELQKVQVAETAENERKAAELRTQVELTKLKIAADLLKTKATLDAQAANQEIDATLRTVELAAQQAETTTDRIVSQDEAERGRQHEAGMADRAMVHQAALQEQAAALAPAPPTEGA